jgi:hypothetical protein
MKLEDLRHETWFKLLSYQDPVGIHPIERAWRERCRTLLKIAREYEKTVEDQRIALLDASLKLAEAREIIERT